MKKSSCPQSSGIDSLCVSQRRRWLRWCAVVVGVAAVAGFAFAKTPPRGSLTATFPAQGSTAGKPAVIALTLAGTEATEGKLSFETTHFTADGGVATNAVRFAGLRKIGTGETKELTVSVAQEGVFETIVRVEDAVGGVAALVLVIVNEKGKLWFGRDNLMNVAAQRLEAQAKPEKRAQGAAAPETAQSIEELERQMSALFAK